jgi:hypothetical protein
MSMKVSEQVCPVCLNKNELEAVVCMYCGTALDDPFLDPEVKGKTSETPTLVTEQSRVWSVDESAVPEKGIAVYAEGIFHPVYTNSSREFVIGRKVGIASDDLFDLAPLGGYHLGLSRRHASIRRTEREYEICDLGSLNGTWLNGERLVPHKPYPMPNNSHLRLGSIRLYLLYRPFRRRG